MEYIELLTKLTLIVFASKLIAEITDTVDILWYIILGLIGTQYFFHIDPHQLENWATLGVVFIMFYAGWKEDLLKFIFEIWKNKWVALIGAIGPFLGAFLSFILLRFQFHEAIVAGFIFTSTAVPYTVAVLNELGLEKTRAAKTVLSSSVADNFISIFMAVGVLPAFALLHLGELGDASFGKIALEVIEQMGFIFGAFALFAALGLIILPDARMHIRMNIPQIMQRDGIFARITYWLYRLREAPGLYTLTRAFSNVRIGIPLTLLLVFGLAWFAHKLGLHPAIAAYLTGLILHVEMYHSTKKSKIIDDTISIDHKNLSIFFYFLQEWIGPIFFIYLGSQMIVELSRVPDVIIASLVSALLIGIAQYASAYYAGLKTSRLPRHDARLLGFAMLPRDVIAFVVLGLAITTGLIHPESIFVIITIVTVLILNITTTFVIRWFKPHYERCDKHYQTNSTHPCHHNPLHKRK